VDRPRVGYPASLRLLDARHHAFGDAGAASFAMSEALTEGASPDGTLGFLHVDMDAFFASVELRRHPELAGLPVVVGGSGDRGVVAAASYSARSYGIHSAMPSSRARRLCPQVVFIEGDHAHYAEVSRKVMSIMGDFTPLVEPLSLDEAFLDVRGALHDNQRPEDIAARIRHRILAEESLTCSVGVATNKFLAKLATSRAKPRATPAGPEFGSGVYTVAQGRELEFLRPLAVGELWGVGPATGAKLSRMGIETVGDLADQPRTRLIASLGQAQGRHLHRLAHAIDERPVVIDSQMKSVSHEETFARDISNPVELGRRLLRLSDAVAFRLRSGGWMGRTVSIKVRFADFTTITRSATVTEPIDGTGAITDAASVMLATLDTGAGVRLLGVAVSHLSSSGVRQLTLDELAGSRNATDPVVDEIRGKFGGDSIGRAAAMSKSGRLANKSVGDAPWGPSVHRDINAPDNDIE